MSATILLRLVIGIFTVRNRSDVEKGGETVFPASKVNASEVPDWDQRSECAKRGLSVRPRMGDALLFWSMKPDAKLDPTSLHGMILVTDLVVVKPVYIMYSSTRLSDTTDDVPCFYLSCILLHDIPQSSLQISSRELRHYMEF